MEELERLCYDLMLLKKEEKAVADVRIAVENQIAQMVSTKEEGTDKAEAGEFKITVTSKLTRTLDYPAYLSIEGDIPEMFRCVDLKPAINLRVLKMLEMANPDLPAHFVTSKPAKAAVKVEAIA